MIRGSPSTTRTRRSKAFMLFFFPAFVTFLCTAFICSWSANLARSARRVATSRRAYQTSRCASRRTVHRLAVGADRAEDAARVSWVNRGRARDREARRKALDVRLQGPGRVSSKSFTSNTRLRSGAAKTRSSRGGDRRMPGREPGHGGLREVHRHDRCCATKKRERRGEHPPVADRDELLDAALGLVLEHLDRISPARCRLPFSVARARNLLPRRLAGGCALLWGGGVHGRRFGGRGGHGFAGQCGTGDTRSASMRRCFGGAPPRRCCEPSASSSARSSGMKWQLGSSSRSCGRCPRSGASSLRRLSPCALRSSPRIGRLPSPSRGCRRACRRRRSSPLEFRPPVPVP